MNANTSSIRATLVNGLFGLPALAASGSAVVPVPVPGIAPGDFPIVPTVLNGVLPISFTATCAVAGTMLLEVFNSNGAPTPGGASPIMNIVIIRNTGSI